jgi:hypothetical protein
VDAPIPAAARLRRPSAFFPEAFMTQILRLAAIPLAVAGLAGAAWAQSAEAEFPASIAPAEIAAWMKRNTDIDPASVVAITPSAVTGVLSSISTPEGPSIRRVNLRSEALSRAAFEQDHALSWTSVVEVDCKKRLARLGRTMVYAERNLIGDGRETVAASPAWIKPIAGGPSYNAMLKVCDGKMVNPLAGATRVAAAPPAKAAAKPAAKAAEPKAAAPASKPPAKPPAVVARAEPAEPKPSAKPPPAKAAAAAPAKAAAAAKPGRFVAQVAAAPAEAAAKRRLDAVQVKAELPAGVVARVAKAVVGGKTVYRAQFAGFQTTAEAQAFCRDAAPDGCFVRPGS